MFLKIACNWPDTRLFMCSACDCFCSWRANEQICVCSCVWCVIAHAHGVQMSRCVCVLVCVVCDCSFSWRGNEQICVRSCVWRVIAHACTLCRTHCPIGHNNLIINGVINHALESIFKSCYDYRLTVCIGTKSLHLIQNGSFNFFGNRI